MPRKSRGIEAAGMTGSRSGEVGRLSIAISRPCFVPVGLLIGLSLMAPESIRLPSLALPAAALETAPFFSPHSKLLSLTFTGLSWAVKSVLN